MTTQGKKMIIKGVGYMLAKVPGTGELITLANLQNLKIDLTVNLEDIFGGDGYFAIDTLVKDKAINVTATDAKFDMNMVRLMMGSELKEDVAQGGEDGFVHVLNEQKVMPFAQATPQVFTYNLAYGADMFDQDMAIRIVGTNRYLPVTFGSGVPNAGEAMVDMATGMVSVLVDAKLSGQTLAVNYRRKALVDVMALLSEELPFPVTVVHHGSFQQKDGSYQGIETELYLARAKGSLNLDFARATAAVNQVSLEILDPERADQRLGTIKRYESTKHI